MPASPSAADVMRAYRERRQSARRGVLSRYRVLGFLNAGTYGRVYKAEDAPLTASAERPGVYAIKKFKLDREDDTTLFRGVSQSAIREIALNRELAHENVCRLWEVLLEDNAVFLVYEFVDHDFLQIIHHYLTVVRTPIGGAMIKSLMWQLLNGIAYLHANGVMHRDLKPANILITGRGVVKIGDLGLARIYSDPLMSLYTSDMVVVTIWYRAPELLLGARHYTPAIDLWAAGCIWGELMALRPMFKGEEVRMPTRSKTVPLQVCVASLTPATSSARSSTCSARLTRSAGRASRPCPSTLLGWHRGAPTACQRPCTGGTSTGPGPRAALVYLTGYCSTIPSAARLLRKHWSTHGSPRRRSLRPRTPRCSHRLFPLKSPYPPGRVVVEDTAPIVPRGRRPPA